MKNLLVLALVALYASVTAESVVKRRILEGEAGWRDVIRHVKSYELHDFSAHEPTRRALDAVGEKTMTYDLEVFGRRVTLELERFDELFAEGYQHHYMDANHNILRSEGPLDCIYKGKVIGEASRASVSFCGGMIHASVHHDDNPDLTFTIQPLDIKQETTKEHVAYLHRDLQDAERFCGVDRDEPSVRRLDEDGKRQKDHFHNLEAIREVSSKQHLRVQEESSTRRRQLGTTKYVGVAVINDNKRYSQKGQSVHLHSASLFSVANSLYAKLGVATASTFKIELQINSMYTFVSGDPWTLVANSPSAPPTSQVRLVSGELNSADLLKALEAWRHNTINSKEHDLAHLLTGYTFASTTIGLANLPGLCIDGAKSGETQATDITDAHQASTITHEIGHNLGSSHTDTPPSGFTSCVNTVEAIMSASSGFGFTNWETCTAEYFRAFFTSTQYTTLNCAENPSSLLFTGSPVCGDGLVQGDEECDCINQVCTGVDKCCNGATCKFNSGSTCSETDPCCDAPTATTCTPVTDSSKICRAAVGPCDITERCTGTSGKCPFDSFNETGTPCTTTNTASAGTCFNKQCLSRKEECVNRGSTFSPPWVDTCSASGQCEISCEGSTGGCFSFTGSTVYYADGTKCATGKGCLSGSCVAFSEIPVSINPNCSNAVLDVNETDIDCGGPCFGCAVGLNCSQDTDCLFPGSCNKTGTLVNSNGYIGLGKCSSTPRTSSTEDLLNTILQWFRDNPFIWGPIVGAIALLCLLCCLCSSVGGSRRGATPNGMVIKN